MRSKIVPRLGSRATTCSGVPASARFAMSSADMPQAPARRSSRVCARAGSASMTTLPNHDFSMAT